MMKELKNGLISQDVGALSQFSAKDDNGKIGDPELLT
jgi:hypothetical protein